MDKAELIEVILTELKELCEENEIDASDVDSQTALFGSGSLIDSMALVSLIITVEEHVLEATGKEIQVVDESAIITEGQTPFRNAETLAELTLIKAGAE